MNAWRSITSWSLFSPSSSPATRNYRKPSFEEEAKGSLEVGKLADLVILGEDPFTADPHSIADIPVLATIVGGRTVYQRND